ncbi:non-specific lipid-transfer protein 1 [Setaria viridis]
MNSNRKPPRLHVISTYKYYTLPHSSLDTDEPSAMKKTSAFAALLLAMLAVHQLMAVPPVRAAVSCSGVMNHLSLCLEFLQGDADEPGDRCCKGVKAICAAADTAAERQATCKCLKSAYNLVDADLYATQTLTGLCGVPLSYTISPDTDCSEIE